MTARELKAELKMCGHTDVKKQTRTQLMNKLQYVREAADALIARNWVGDGAFVNEAGMSGGVLISMGADSAAVRPPDAFVDGVAVQVEHTDKDLASWRAENVPPQPPPLDDRIPYAVQGENPMGKFMRSGSVRNWSEALNGYGNQAFPIRPMPFSNSLCFSAEEGPRPADKRESWQPTSQGSDTVPRRSAIGAVQAARCRSLAR